MLGTADFPVNYFTISKMEPVIRHVVTNVLAAVSAAGMACWALRTSP
jgi:hypothetical protein